MAFAACFLFIEKKIQEMKSQGVNFFSLFRTSLSGGRKGGRDRKRRKGNRNKRKGKKEGSTKIQRRGRHGNREGREVQGGEKYGGKEEELEGRTEDTRGHGYLENVNLDLRGFLWDYLPSNNSTKNLKTMFTIPL